MQKYPEIIRVDTELNGRRGHIGRIYLCRHGETAMNARGGLQGMSDYPLNEIGISQANSLGNYLKDENLHVICSSSLGRAKKTADIVSKYQKEKIDVIEIPELVEISWGEWEGKQYGDHISALLNDWNSGKYESKAPVGESPFEVEIRAVPVLYDFILKNPGKNMLFVLHGRLLRILLSSVLFHSLDYMNHFTHQNCCINILDIIIDQDLNEINRDAASARDTVLDTYHILDSFTNKLPEKENNNSDTVSSAVNHPTNITIIPIILDDRRHLE